jgi:hypothetical protein
VCQQGTRIMNNILKLKITTMKSLLESVRQIIRQKPAKASGVIYESRLKMSIKSAGLARHVGIYENRLQMPIKSVSLARHVRIYEIRRKMLITLVNLTRHVGIYENRLRMSIKSV